jgi:hypothetical protein
VIATLGAQIKVRVYQSARDRSAARDGVDVSAVVTSNGPPGTVGVWARTLAEPRKWLLVRKSQNVGADWEAVEGDQGKFD